MSVATYTKSGGKASVAGKLPKAIFGVEKVNHHLIRTSYEATLANQRKNLAQTLTRGLVRGGGKKPWRQKGTGRARFGSSRVPIWRGGGITFGPTGVENYSQKINAKASKLALSHALTLAAEANKIVLIEELPTLKVPKTQEIAKLLKKMDLKRNSLMVYDEKNDTLRKSCSNIGNLSVCLVANLSTKAVMDADHIILSNASLAKLVVRLGDKK